MATAANGLERPEPDAAALVRRWFDEVWNRGMESTIDELFPPTSVMWGAETAGRSFTRADGI